MLRTHRGDRQLGNEPQQRHRHESDDAAQQRDLEALRAVVEASEGEWSAWAGRASPHGSPGLLKIGLRDLPFFAIYGSAGLALMNALWTYSVQFNGAAVATVLAYSAPAFTVLLAWPLLQRLRRSPR